MQSHKGVCTTSVGATLVSSDPNQPVLAFPACSLAPFFQHAPLHFVPGAKAVVLVSDVQAQKHVDAVSVDLHNARACKVPHLHATLERVRSAAGNIMQCRLNRHASASCMPCATISIDAVARQPT